MKQNGARENTPLLDTAEALRNLDNEGWYDQWKSKRFKILMICCSAFFILTLSANMYYPLLPFVRDDLGTTDELIALTTAFDGFSLSVFPFLFGAIADHFGRKFAMMIALPIACLGFIVSGIAPNIWWLIGSRVFGFGALGITVTLPPTIVGDVYPATNRAFAHGCYSAAGALGGFLGPVLAGNIDAFIGWRPVFYITAGLIFALFVAVVTLMDETRPPLKKKKSFNPLHPLILLKYPTLTFTCLYWAILGGLRNSLLATLPLFLGGETFGLSSQQASYSYLAYRAGFVIGSLIGGHLAGVGLKWLGKGGRLVFPLIAMFFLTIVTSVYGFFVERGNLPVTLVMAFLISTLVSINRSGVTYFGIEDKPQFSAEFSSLMWMVFGVIVAPVIALAVPAIAWIGSGFFHMYYCGIILIAAHPLIFLAWKHSKIEVDAETQLISNLTATTGDF